MKRIIYIGAEHELRYNKTQAMHEAFSIMPVPYEFIDIKANAKSRLSRAIELMSAYWKLYRKLRTLNRGGVLWLSEFKFAPWHSFFSRLIALATGMKLIGGPHVLASDRVLLVDSSYQRPTLSVKQQLNLLKLRLDNALTVLFLDAVQSYTEDYIGRIRELPFASSKPSIFFPISIPEPIYRAAADSYDAPRSKERGGPLRIVFWGIPTILHGLDTLVHAVHLVRSLNIDIEVNIFAPQNAFVTEAESLSRKLGVAHCLTFDYKTKINSNFNLVRDADIAVSHLVAIKSSRRTREVIDTMASTNKILEIWALGLPALVARGSAASSLMGPGCLYVDPANSQSVADTIVSFWGNNSMRLDSGIGQMIKKRAQLSTPNNVSKFVYDQIFR